MEARAAAAAEKGSVELTVADVPRREALIQDIPLPPAICFTCLQYTISVSLQAVLLKADSGETAHFGVEPSFDQDHLRTLCSQRVLVTCTAHYRPTVSIQQISVEWI